MGNSSILDLVKISPITYNFWLHELDCTEDEKVLRCLLHCYLDIIKGTPQLNISYIEVYNKVFHCFEEAEV